MGECQEFAARSLVLLNESGDTTITWEPHEDDAMMAIIEKKMAAGVTFYIVTPRKAKPKKLKAAGDALKHRALSIPDSDFSKFVMEGRGKAVQTSAEPVKTVRRAKTAKEVAGGHAVGVAPRRGG